MFLVRRPTERLIARFLAGERASAFSYAALGCTERDVPVPGYVRDGYGTALGEGALCFRHAKEALARFYNYPPAWTRVVTDGGARPREGLTFVAHIEHFGFHSLNGCRVLRVRDEPLAYGFSFGTLFGHEEEGEERFLITLDPATQVVRYDVLAYSRPRGALARLGAPLARRLQRRFHRDTCEAMQRAAR
jgi:uncharacterized protein (UPF0548 family)